MTVYKNVTDDLHINDLLIRCDCGAGETLYIVDMWEEDDGPDYFAFSITYYPLSWREKIHAVWRILRGSRYGYTEEILMTRWNTAELASWFMDRLHTRKPKRRSD